MVGRNMRGAERTLHRNQRMQATEVVFAGSPQCCSKSPPPCRARLRLQAQLRSAAKTVHWQCLRSSVAPPASASDANSILSQHRSKRKHRPIKLDGLYILVEAAGIGQSWPASALACALAFAGSWRCHSNSPLTPRPYRTRIRFRHTQSK